MMDTEQAIGAMVARKRRHIGQAFALGALLGYAIGVWSALVAR